jgi:peptidoglycan hydrolase-like protein with peptidoglycan-binding domain
MLSIKERQRLLKAIGFYADKIDGIEGKNTKRAYKQLQEKYMRKKDVDGIYGINTERCLVSVYRVKTYTKNFSPEELKCECGGKWCTGYPAVLSIDLLKYAQKLRDKYGVMYVTSGLRCEKLNASVGGIRGSKHTQGKAIDFYNTKTRTLADRKKIIDWYATTCFNMNYCYCNGYARYKFRREYPSVPTMATSIHFDVK